MKRSEVAALLAMAAAFDQRTIGDADVAAWHALLEGTSFADAQAAVREHYTTNRHRLMPADVLAGVKRIRDKRLDENPEPCPPAELLDDPARYRAWLLDVRKAIADGTLVTAPEVVAQVTGTAGYDAAVRRLGIEAKRIPAEGER